MGRLLEIFRRETERELSELSEIRTRKASASGPRTDLIRFLRFFRSFQELERRRPFYVDQDDWQQAVEDGRRFLATWGEQAERLGWTSKDVFGLAPVPEKPAANYRRLSRRDLTGLVWFLHGCPVIALTDTGASIRQRSGNVITYYRRPIAGDEE
jgi:hypothetical protein